MLLRERRLDVVLWVETMRIQRAASSAGLESRILIFEHDSHPVYDLRRALRAGLRQLSERMPEPLAQGRERSHAPLPL